MMYKVLAVEDSRVDWLRIRASLTNAKMDGVGVDLHRAEDGEEALEMLIAAADTDQPFSLLLVDLNMPGMNGHELLAQIREHPEISGIYIAVLSSSEEPDDIRKSYNLGAAAYVVKPLPTAILQVLRQLRLSNA